MSNQCRWLHDWGKWEYVSHYDARDSNMKCLGTVTHQFRVCARCGYTQAKLDTVLI